MSDKRTAAGTSRPSDIDEGRSPHGAAAGELLANTPVHNDPPDADAVPDQDRHAERLSKALEQSAAGQMLSGGMFDEAIGQATTDGVAPAPTNRDALRGKASASAASMQRPKRRRSAGIMLVKVVLPLVALVTLGYLTYWWYVHNRESVINVVTPDKPSANAPVVTVSNFKYSATDSQNRPYTITADSATQPQDKAVDTITLVRPQANFTLANNHWLTITAQTGQYHRNADLIDLDGDVTMFHDNGMSFHTSHAQIDMKAKIAAGSDPVQGQNATSDISSEGFRILDDGDTVIFTGKSRLQLHNKGKDGNQ